MTYNKSKLLVQLLIASLLSLVFILPTYAFKSFVVKRIEIQGLTGVKRATVMSYLPIREGERLTATKSDAIINALYDTGFFNNVSISRNSGTLIVTVNERQTIGRVTFHGNKKVNRDTLLKVLKASGIVAGNAYDKATLAIFETSLKQEYTNLGLYNASVHAQTVAMSRNRVSIHIDIKEASKTKIKAIHFIGNKRFSDSSLRRQLPIGNASILNWFTKKEYYSEAKLNASAGALEAYYLNRGYLQFKLVSKTAELSSDNRYVTITFVVHEGPKYTFSGYALAGRFPVPEKNLHHLINIRHGKVFSRAIVTDGVNQLGQALGNKGYGFPNIQAKPRVNEAQHSVFITYVIQPGRRYYVHRIHFSGNTKTADYVLRQSMQQPEGGLLSLDKVQQSSRHLRLLSYLSNIHAQTNKVPGTNNQVDLNYHVTEAASASGNASVGYGTNGFVISAGFNQLNFLGTGRSVGINGSWSKPAQSVSVNYFNPYWRADGTGRGFSLFFQRFKPGELGTIGYTTNRFGGAMNFSREIDDKTSVQYGLGYNHLRITTLGVDPDPTVVNFTNKFGRSFNEAQITAGVSHNTFDQLPFPTRGMLNQLSGQLNIQADSKSLNYFKVGYSGSFYHPLVAGMILHATGSVDYGDSISKSSGLPFFDRYYAGGIAQPGQVRGYDNFGLGPQDMFRNALGGNLLVAGSVAVILPHPLSGQSYRSSVFVDAGNVYMHNQPTNFALSPQGFNGGPLRYSAGVAVDWRSPFGPLQFSLGYPINRQPGDLTQVFQFTVSSSA